METIRGLAHRLTNGEVTARQLVEEHLERIAAPDGEGERAFLHVADAEARHMAAAYDALRANGGSLPPFAGIPVAVKDLCDIAGQVTTAGSVVLGGNKPASVDAPVVARLRSAGFIIIGRTNMTEFAYSGLGLNAHYGTPASPWERDSGPRIPGGSSSGTAVAVADQMAVAGLGTDTGGSCRIPAAFCGLVGFKPTANRIPREGVVPLSTSLDSIGPIAPTVDCCEIIDDVFAGGNGVIAESARPSDHIRLASIQDYVLEDLDPEVARVYERSLAQLDAAGVEIAEVSFPELKDLPEINRKGGVIVAEAFAWHQELLERSGDVYDQRVRVRMEPGADMSAAEYLQVLQRRAEMIEAAKKRMAGFDAFVLPSVAVLPPTINSFSDGNFDYYTRQNLLCLRNTTVGNFLDSCAISIPATGLGQPPVGVMLMGGPGDDAALFQLARTVEATIQSEST